MLVMSYQSKLEFLFLVLLSFFDATWMCCMPWMNMKLSLCLCLIVSHQAITTPAMAVSHIMLEAYKKYILVSLILHGKVQQLPKYTSQIVGRFIKVRINCIGRINSVWTIFFCFFGTAVTQQSKICCLFKQKTSLSVFTCGRAETLAALCTVYIFSCLQNMPEFSTKYWVHLPIPITCIRSKSYF